jgi:hypothetical protein
MPSPFRLNGDRFRECISLFPTFKRINGHFQLLQNIVFRWLRHRYLGYPQRPFDPRVSQADLLLLGNGRRLRSGQERPDDLDREFRSKVPFGGSMGEAERVRRGTLQNERSLGEEGFDAVWY